MGLHAEDIAIVRRTVMAAYDAVVPAGCQRTIYLCDDGKDPKKRKFCDGIGPDVRIPLFSLVPSAGRLMCIVHAVRISQAGFSCTAIQLDPDTDSGVRRRSSMCPGASGSQAR